MDMDEFRAALGHFMATNGRAGYLDVPGSLIYLRKNRAFDRLELANIAVYPTGQGTFRAMLPVLEGATRLNDYGHLFTLRTC